MSKVLGRMVTCDRCGATAFAKRTIGASFNLARVDVFENLDGWGKGQDDIDLCPECYEEWTKIVEDFKKEKI